MKSKLGFIVTLVLVLMLMLTACDEYRNAQDKETPWHCKGICRTWVVFNGDHDPKRDRGHLIEMDKFLIQQLGENINFVALSQLKLRWGKELMKPFEFSLTQIGGSQFGPDSRFCGFVDISSDDHDPKTGSSHMFKINLVNKNMLEITWSPTHLKPVQDNLKSVEDLTPKDRMLMCDALDENHGGTAHAQPD